MKSDKNLFLKNSCLKVLAPCLGATVGDPTEQWVEHLFDCLVRTYEKLKELGFTYYQGKVSVIDVEEDSNV